MKSLCGTEIHLRTTPEMTAYRTRSSAEVPRTIILRHLERYSLTQHETLCTRTAGMAQFSQPQWVSFNNQYGSDTETPPYMRNKRIYDVQRVDEVKQG